MKRTFVVVATLLVALSLAGSAQASSTWSQTYPAHWSTDTLIGTSDGGYAIIGGFGYTIEGVYTGSGSLTRVDFFLSKIDASGVLQWTQRYSGGERGDAEATSAIQTSDGGYALVGRISDSVRSYDGDVWLVKTDSSGNMEWSHTYSVTGVVFGSDLVQTGDGGYAVIGASYGNSDPGIADFWLMKTDAEGNVLWNQTYGTAENYEAAYSLVQALDGGYVLVGNTYNFSASSIWMVKVDALGNMEWNQTFSGTNSTGTGGPQALVATSDGGYALIGGKTQPFTTTHGAVGTGWLIKTNAKGEEEWNRTFGTLGSADGLGSLIQASDGGYTLVGTIGADDPATEGDVWLVKTDSEGNMLWNKTYGGMPDCNGQASSDSGHGLVQASDGGYTILCETTFPVPSSSFGEVRDWLIKTDGAGNAPKLSDVYPPVTNLPPIPRQSPTSSEQPQLPVNILLGVIIAGVVGASVLAVLPFKMRKRSKIES